MLFTCATVSEGFFCFMRAIVPATTGVAIEVPLAVAYPVPSQLEYRLTPGATTPWSFAEKPLPEKEAILSVLPTAPTVITPDMQPGLDTPLLELPAAATTTFPWATA